MIVFIRKNEWQSAQISTFSKSHLTFLSCTSARKLHEPCLVQKIQVFCHLTLLLRESILLPHITMSLHKIGLKSILSHQIHKVRVKLLHLLTKFHNFFNRVLGATSRGERQEPCRNKNYPSSSAAHKNSQSRTRVNPQSYSR